MPDYIRSLRKIIGHRKIIHPAARIIIENDQGEILLIRRKDNDQWGLIAGAMEEGENIRDCIIREVKEETGLQIDSLTGIGLSTQPEKETVRYPNGDITQYFTVVFYSNQWSGELVQQTVETKEARFFALSQIPSLPPNESPSLEWLKMYKETGIFMIE